MWAASGLESLPSGENCLSWHSQAGVSGATDRTVPSRKLAHKCSYARGSFGPWPHFGQGIVPSILAYHELSLLGYSASQLVGAVLHVNSLGHAVFVNAATGTTWDKVMVCSYNNCRKNVKLSLLYPAKNDSANAVEVIIPQTFQGGQTGLRVYGDLLNAIVTHTVTRSLVGHSDVTCSSLEMVLLNPNGGQAGRWTASNTNVISASYNNWNITGEWSLKITGKTSAGASMTWYGTIRVV